MDAANRQAAASQRHAALAHRKGVGLRMAEL
jgi:hypothetical protein